MKTESCQEAYKDGIEAAWRVGKYEGATDVPDCLYPRDSEEWDAWHEGFGDGTEDFIACQRREL